MVQHLIEEGRRRKAQIVDQVARNNHDLAERVDAEGFEVNYLPEDDYLRLIIGEPTESISITHRDGAYVSIMVDPETYKITALEIPDFTSSLSKIESEEGKSFLQGIAAALAHREGVSLRFPSRSDRERAIRGLGDLVFA